MDGHFNLRLMLGTTSPQFFKVIGALWEVFEPDSELSGLREGNLLLDGLLFLLFVCNFLEALLEPFVFLGFETTERHGVAGKDLVGRS